MTSTYTTNQGLEKPAAGDQSGTWGGTVNTNMDIIDRAICGVTSLTLTGSSTTLTTTDGTLTDGMYRVLILGDSGDLGSDNTITISPNDQSKCYLVYNNLTADRNAIFTQGSGANATVENGETAWIYADGAGGGAAVRTALSSTKLLDQDGDTGIRVEEGGDDDDTIRFDIAGAEDFTMTANTLNVLSGSDLNINSGGTLTNAGTAYGFDNLPAFAGVLEANAAFVDQAIFGPAVDGMPWNGKWTANDSSGALLFTSLMLVTIETDDTHTEVNIWDLTEQSAGAISTSAIDTITLTGDATPTSVAACMGYIIVGSEDGTSIIDPHSGSWAERTTGYPKNLTTSTVPALQSNTIDAVGAGFARQPDFDPRTGGPLPTFVAGYTSGSYACEVIKTDGTSYRAAWTAGEGPGVGIYNGRVVAVGGANGRVRVSDSPIENITADGFTGGYISSDTSTTFPQTHGANTAMSNIVGNQLALADTAGLTMVRAGAYIGGKFDTTTNALINRTYNTGYLIGDTRGAWLSNSATTDRSSRANTLTNNGSPVTEAAVESGAELMGYSGFSASDNLSRASDADWDVVGTGAIYLSCWFKSAANSAQEYFINFGNSGADVEYILLWDSSGRVEGRDDGATASVSIATTDSFDDGVWHKGDFVRVSSTERYLYVDGVLKNSSTTDAGSLSDSGNLPLYIGVLAADGSSGPADDTTLSLAKISATAPTATQIRQMYDAEKPMFVASAECLLQSGSTDAVLDVDVDPLTGKVLVTQTDAITIFDGLAVDKLFADAGKPTVNSGSSEKGKLWGDLRAEQNSANAYVTAPAVDQRQVNEMVRGLASDLPAGVDLSKAKAWIRFNTSGNTIESSLNIVGMTDNGTGRFVMEFGIPFKGGKYAAVGTAGATNFTNIMTFDNVQQSPIGKKLQIYVHRADTNGANDGGTWWIIVFGELENE